MSTLTEAVVIGLGELVGEVEELRGEVKVLKEEVGLLLAGMAKLIKEAKEKERIKNMTPTELMIWGEQCVPVKKCLPPTIQREDSEQDLSLQNLFEDGEPPEQHSN